MYQMNNKEDVEKSNVFPFEVQTLKSHHTFCHQYQYNSQSSSLIK